VQTEYVIKKPSAPVFEHLLKKHAWETPVPHSLYCRIVGPDVPKLMSAPWMRAWQLPQGFTLFPWRELQEEEQQRLLQRHAQTPVWEDGLNPFMEKPQPFEPATSLGLRYQDEVVGWIITERAEPGILRYDRLFVRPEFRKTARGAMLLVAVIQRQHELEGDLPGVGGVWHTEARNTPMVRFIRRRLGPYLTSLTETYGSQKHLTPESEGKE
jgi:GNAT superfamily N-acetyltransferase